MNSQKDSQHLLATGVVTFVVALACLSLYLVFRNGTEDRDIYVATFSACFGLLLAGLWLVDLVSGRWQVIAQAWWEYAWLQWAGRLSQGGIRRLIATGMVRWCAFVWKDRGQPRVCPPSQLFR